MLKLPHSKKTRPAAHAPKGSMRAAGKGERLGRLWVDVGEAAEPRMTVQAFFDPAGHSHWTASPFYGSCAGRMPRPALVLLCPRRACPDNKPAPFSRLRSGASQPHYPRRTASPASPSVWSSGLISRPASARADKYITRIPASARRAFSFSILDHPARGSMPFPFKRARQQEPAAFPRSILDAVKAFYATE